MKVVALAGGVGGAKLVYGLAKSIPDEDLTVVVNTGDDFEFLGLQICPDLDTICYTLAGIANPETGWGRADESWHAWQSLGELGAPTWFRLGDRDLATHIERTRRLTEGKSLHQITREFCQAWGVGPSVLPMSDEAVPTYVKTEGGTVSFQEYFVREKYQPAVQGFRFQGADQAHPAPGVEAALREADLIVICPSNPWVSIDPILAISPIRARLREKPVLAVSPIIGGKAVKGPAAKIFREMGFEPSAGAVARHYGSVLSGFVVDERDRGEVEMIRSSLPDNVSVFTTDTWMKTEEDRVRVARDVLDSGKTLI
jgi:LPPG:FO 2-phospho-L-lactate transferase